MNLEEFKEDDKTSSAVIRKFEIIGEAARHIPESVKEMNENIPWKEITGMRDRLIHGYFGIDFDIVWETIKIDLPTLQVKVQELLES